MTGNEIIKVALFDGKEIRKMLHAGEWWFSVINIVEVLTGSSILKRYWSDLKRKLAKEVYAELYEKIVQLKFAAADGKFYGAVAGSTRRDIEKRSGKPVVTGKNFKELPGVGKKLKKDVDR